MWEEFQKAEMISKEDLETFVKEGRMRPSPQFQSFMRVDENQSYVCESVLETLVDELCLGLVFNVHREAHSGMFELEDVEEPEQCEDGNNTDIFGEPIAQRKTHKCVCPQCKHSLAASRFAPHLAKCLGLGRISSRIASRRIASNSAGYGGGALSDDEDDADWTAGAPERRRRRRDRSGARRLKTQRLARTAPAASSTDLLQVDVDTYEEGDIQSVRESLGRSWEQEHSNTSSPADSASTSSSSSKKREKLPRVKTKNSSKNHKGSPTVLTSLPSLAD